MSDDLVKRLRSGIGRPATWMDCDEVDEVMEQAADRIKELKDRISELESKLAKAVEALGLSLDAINGLTDSNDAFDSIWATLEELKGQNDEG